MARGQYGFGVGADFVGHFAGAAERAVAADDDQVNLATLSTATIATAGTFFPGSVTLGNPAPQASQWGTSGITIVSTNSTSSYYAWDGATLYGPGAAAPSWLTNNTPTTTT